MDCQYHMGGHRGEKNFAFIDLKGKFYSKAIGRLIVGNNVLFQISVESQAMKYQCRAKQCLPIAYICF